VLGRSILKVSFTSLLALSLLALVLLGCAAAPVLPIDSDGEGIIDTVDHCPETPLGNAVDQFDCLNSDNGGVKNDEAQCPRTRAGERVMHNGCSARQGVSIESVRFERGGIGQVPR
jgi:hypothetical protein